MSAAAKRRFGAAAATLLAAAATALAHPASSLAHVPLVGKQDLPIDEWVFVWAVALVLVASFVLLVLGWREPRFEAEDWRSAPRALSLAVVNPATAIVAGLAGVFLLGLVVYSALSGTESPDRNFAVTFVFATFWLGLLVVSVIFGDVFRAFNPWRAIAKAVSGVFTLVAGRPAPPPLAYPERWGRWPAVIGIAGFVWFELIFALSGFQAVGLTPQSVGIAVLVYTGATFMGMALFGIDQWLDRGEAFSVYFNMFSRLSPLEVRDGALGRRRALSGLPGWSEVPGSVALVILVIGVTAFDGAAESLWSGAISSLEDGLSSLGPLTAVRIANSVFMTITVAIVAAIFWAGIAGMRTVQGGPKERTTAHVARVFAHSFVPIALAYLVAHYFTFFLYLEQAQFGYLLSDPLGDGSDLFGTASSGIDYRIIGSNAVWYVQVAALAIGHVVALVLGHDRALAVYRDSKVAARSQYWMLAMMVGFTTLGLFLLSQANA